MIQNIRFTPIDAVATEEKIARLTKRSIKNDSKMFALKLAISMMDLTTLEAKDTPGKVRQLCAKAIRPYEAMPDLPSAAAVCVYPNMVRVAKEALGNSGVKVAAVATAFPSGMSSRKVKIDETKYAVNEGADEIDMVISRGHFLAGEYNFVFDEIAAVKEACGNAHLKVILETGELSTYDNVRLASDIAMYARCRFY
jgi:deoxyribose-phosphate aldolase